MKSSVRDAALPRLDVLMQPETLGDILWASLDNVDRERYSLEFIKVVQLKHKPGRRADAVIRMRLRNREDGSVERLIFNALMMPRPVLEDRFREEMARTYRQPAVGPAVQLVDALDMIVWTFPNDPLLEGLPTVTGPDTLKALVAELTMQNGLITAAHFQHEHSQLVKYVPGDRCSILHKFVVSQNGSSQPLVLFSKTYSNKKDGRALYELLVRLWESEWRRNGFFLVPRPVGYHPGSNTLVMEFIHGQHVESLENLAEKSRECLMVNCGRALAGLQQTTLQLTDYRSRHSEFAGYRKSRHLLKIADDEGSQRLQAIDTWLESSLAHLPCSPTVPNHGAFRLPQLMLVGESVAVLDFDGFLLADPHLDVGSFVAHLLYMATKGELRQETTASAVGTFLASYQSSVPWKLNEYTLRWYTVCLLIGKHAKKYIRFARTGGDETIRRLVRTAHEVKEGKWKLT